MSKITEYTSVNTFDSGDVLLKDGSGGTKIIPVESAATEFMRLGGQTAKNVEIETALTNFGSNLAGLEAEYVATNDYAVGDFFMVENKLYKATEPISDGDTIVPDTNCVETDISTEFKATKGIVDGLSEEIVKKANVDGYYTNLSAGTADQLMASQKVHNSDPYIFRTSGGTSDIGNREELEIVGGSIVWNQKMPKGTEGPAYSGVSWNCYNNGDGSLTIEVTGETGSATTSNNTRSIPSASFTIGHKYLWLGSKSGIRLQIKSIAVISDTVFNCSKSEYSNVALIFTDLPQGSYKIYPMLIDLTAMFGSEIADHIYELEDAEAGAGVAWFRKYFPNDYYEYNPGELMHVSDLQSHDTVGFNLWDEEWEVGGIDNITGAETTSTTIKRSKKYIHVFPNTKYHSSAVGTLGLRYYDANRNFVGSTTVASNSKFVTPSKATYLRLVTATITTADSPVCINLSWSGTRDGEYESYKKHSYPLDPSLTLRGIPKLSADGDLTYDGDIYKPDGTVERWYGIVDLGTLNWAVQTAETGVFKTSGISTLTPNVTNSKIANIICDKFIKSAANTPMPDNAIAVSSNATLYVKDSTYANISAADFKTAMSGVYLVYELATPTTEQAEPYTSPQIVDDWGTEEFVTTSLVPVGHNTKYPANLRDKLQHLPDLPDDDGYYMTQVTGTQMDLVRFRIPQAPAEDGEYVLKATVTDGVPVYTWVDPNATPEETVAQEEPTEPTEP